MKTMQWPSYRKASQDLWSVLSHIGLPLTEMSQSLRRVSSLPARVQLLLGVAAGASLTTGGLTDAVMVAINATIGYVAKSQTD
jgi:hypothetical protein